MLSPTQLTTKRQRQPLDLRRQSGGPLYQHIKQPVLAHNGEEVKQFVYETIPQKHPILPWWEVTLVRDGAIIGKGHIPNAMKHSEQYNTWWTWVVADLGDFTPLQLLS